MPSITSWSRLEPRCRSEDMRVSLQARVRDPLWLLARQWQFGEFKGEDAGSPVVARIRAESSRLSRYLPGMPTGEAAPDGQIYDGRKLPLETLVEREPIHTQEDGQLDFRLNAEAGLHFLRLLEANGVGKYRTEYIKYYGIEPPISMEMKSLDGDSLRFLTVVAQRVPDGSRLYEDMRAALRLTNNEAESLPPEPAIDETDREAVLRVALAWLDWYETLFSEPGTDRSSWNPERMEHAFAVSAHTTTGEMMLVAPEYMGGRLDWYSFDIDPHASLGAKEGDAVTEELAQTAIPSPVNYRGMPAPRWWEFEDAQVNFGAVEAGPEDLARLFLIEFALVYGNDWFLLPVEVGVGSVCRICSLVVTDTFGERLLIRPHRQVDGPESGWGMYSLRVDLQSTEGVEEQTEDILFLPPVLAASLHSSSVEEVLFLRDEMANMAWAVERIVESPSGRPLERYEEFQERRQREADQAETIPTESADSLVYRLASTIPDYWIPLLPVKIEAGKPSIRLERGAMLAPDGSLKRIEPKGRILVPDQQLSMFEEEVPRAGARVSRAYQYTRWIDGSTHLWIGRRKRPGRGEGSSGLRFDTLVSMTRFEENSPEPSR